MSRKSGWFKLKHYQDHVFVVYDYTPGTKPTQYTKTGDPGDPGDPELIDIIRVSTDTFTPDLTDILSETIIDEIMDLISSKEGKLHEN